MNAALQLDIPYIDPFEAASRIDIENLRERHPSEIAEALEAADLPPLEIVETLLKIGNRKAVETFAQLPFEIQRACL
ncbi:MAG TPA: hypothetical protein VK852_09610, partial [Desulfobacterales bacterium]|nr:hypothetical protein [Desulfobacterales bacterium]